MKLYFIFIFKIWWMLLYAQSPNWNWVQSSTGTSDEFMNDFKVDSDGNIVCVGLYAGGEIAFCSSRYNFNQSNYMFISKYDKLGNCLWSNIYGSQNDYFGYMYNATDLSGNIYVTGRFIGELSIQNYKLKSENGLQNCFIIKFSPQGEIIWLKQFQGDKWAAGNTIAVDSSQNVYLSGSTGSSELIIDNINLINEDKIGYRSFVLKLDSSGIAKWGVIFQGNGGAYPVDLELDLDNNIIVSGYFYDSFIQIDSIRLINYGGNSSTKDTYVFKFDNAGKVIQYYHFGGKLYDEGAYLKVDNKNNLYVSGIFSSPEILIDGKIVKKQNPTTLYDYYIIKYSPLGEMLWYKSENAGNVILLGCFMDTDEKNNLYVAYAFSTPEYRAKDEVFINRGSWDGLVYKYSSEGELKWIKSYAGKRREVAVGVKAIREDELIIAGEYTSDTLIFEKDTIFNEGKSTGSGNPRNIFVAKLGMTTNTKGVNETNKILLYPNPTNDKLQILFKESRIQDIMDVSIYNLSGVAMPIIFDVKNTNNSILLNVSNYSDGLYILNIKTPQGIIAQKFVVQH